MPPKATGPSPLGSLAKNRKDNRPRTLGSATTVTHSLGSECALFDRPDLDWTMQVDTHTDDILTKLKDELAKRGRN